jgi:hypothetical protein
MSGNVRLYPLTRTSSNINRLDLLDIQIMDGGVDNYKAAKMQAGELKRYVLEDEPLKWKGLISQNAPIASTNADTMRAGQIWELSGVANPADYAFFDTYELVSGTLYDIGSKYRVSVDTSFTFSNSFIEYDGAPYIVSTDSLNNISPNFNDLGGNCTFSYVGAGIFQMLSSADFGVNKTKTLIYIGSSNVNSAYMDVYYKNDSKLIMKSFNSSDVPSDNIFQYTTLEIQVFP